MQAGPRAARRRRLGRGGDPGAGRGAGQVQADGLARLAVQALGVAATWVWSGGVSWILLKLVSLVTPLRADEQDEWTGMDASESGERGYITSDLESAAERDGRALAS